MIAFQARLEFSARSAILDEWSLLAIGNYAVVDETSPCHSLTFEGRFELLSPVFVNCPERETQARLQPISGI